MKKIVAAVIACLTIVSSAAFANGNLEFTFEKLESGQAGNTLLVVGGISGDEPGGFNAASLLITHYKINTGNVWVVPNLNFISIIKRLRGVYGDLNRKFASIKSSDPEFETIQKIKSIILDDQVDLILNLHDGSGFYRPEYQDKNHSPRRWGQTVIVDQEKIEIDRFGNLAEIAQQVVKEVNRNLLSAEHLYHVKNTKTHLGNAEMSKSLSYFAIRNRKPAFGLEASKSLKTHERTYYHLSLLEAYMDHLGIEYERSFELAAHAVEEAINSNIRLALCDDKILLEVANARNLLRFIPLKKAPQIVYKPSNPLLAIVHYGKGYRIHHGNRRITKIDPEYFEYDSSIDSVTMQIDGSEKRVRFGEMVTVGRSFSVVPQEGYRVNVIGFKRPGPRNESGITLKENDIQKRFSLDRTGHIYRVEVYKGKRFSGMVLVNFSDQDKNLFASNPSKFYLRTLPISEKLL
jgi:hypothetical protein